MGEWTEVRYGRRRRRPHSPRGGPTRPHHDSGRRGGDYPPRGDWSPPPPPRSRRPYTPPRTRRPYSPPPPSGWRAHTPPGTRRPHSHSPSPTGRRPYTPPGTGRPYSRSGDRRDHPPSGDRRPLFATGDQASPSTTEGLASTVTKGTPDVHSGGLVTGAMFLQIGGDQPTHR